jgi:hypothetical protein
MSYIVSLVGTHLLRDGLLDRLLILPDLLPSPEHRVTHKQVEKEQVEGIRELALK